MKRPLIGIVATPGTVDMGIGKKPIQFVNQDYIDALSIFNASSLIISLDTVVTDSLVEVLDGLLLVGGEDIAEDCYQGKRSCGNKRDLLEIQLYEQMKMANKPILGICRGMQLINVAEGGTLKNIDDSSVEHMLGGDGWVNYHEIEIHQQTKVYQMIKKENYYVSSVHHQRVDELGHSLIIAATSEDGIVEAIEHKEHGFIVGFQGHIEKGLDNYKNYKNVFEEFIKETNSNG